jgi:hypothetical protein
MLEADREYLGSGLAWLTTPIGLVSILARSTGILSQSLICLDHGNYKHQQIGFDPEIEVPNKCSLGGRKKKD